MLKWTALLLSIAACGLYDLYQQRQIADIRAEIKIKEAEIRPLAAFDREVEQYRTEKSRLQKRIDLINQLKQNQRRIADAVATLAAIEEGPARIDSAAVIAPDDIVINGHADSDAAIEELAKRIGASEQKIAPDHSFTLRVKR